MPGSRSILCALLAAAVAAPAALFTTGGPGFAQTPVCNPLATDPAVQFDLVYGVGTNQARLHKFPDSGETLGFYLKASNPGTGPQGQTVGCTYDNAYLRVTAVGGNTVSTPAKPLAVGAANVEWSILGWLPGNEGVRTVTVRLQNDAGGGAHAPEDQNIIPPQTVRYITRLRPDFIVKNGGTDPDGVEIKGVELYEGGVRRDHQPLSTDYDTAGWVAHVVIRNIGNMHAAEPNTMSSDPIGYTCTQTGVRLRDDTQTAGIVTDDTCTTSTKGLPYKVTLNLTPVDNGDGVVAGGEPRQLTVDVPTTVPLRLQDRFPCRPERQAERDNADIHALRGQIVSQCFLNATFTVGMDRAGEWNYTAFADPGPNDMVPEKANVEGTNDYQRDLSIKGSDLRVDDFTYTVSDLADNELELCGDSPENACDAGHVRIRLQGKFTNGGDAGMRAGGSGGAVGNEVVNWRFEGDLSGIQAPSEDWAECLADAPETTVTYGRLPEEADCILEANDSSADLVTNSLEARREGLVTVKLIADSRGRVFEKDEANNFKLFKINFTDATAPDIRSIDIDPDDDIDTASAAREVREGVPIHLQVKVLESGVIGWMNGTLSRDDGQPDLLFPFEFKEHTTEQVGQTPVDLWEAETTIEGFTAKQLNLTLSVVATDTAHQSSSGDPPPLAIKVLPWPKTITGAVAFLNDQASATHPDDPARDRWNSTKWNEPKDQVYIEAEVADTGFEEDSTEGKTVAFVQPDGTRAKDGTREFFPMAARDACTLTPIAGQGGPVNGRDEECTSAVPTGFTPGDTLHKVFAVYTGLNRGDVEGIDLALDRIGNWTAAIRVNDTNEKKAWKNVSFEIFDRPNTRDGHADFVTGPTIAGTSGAPGSTVKVSAEVTDELKVERVFVDATHIASGLKAEFPLGLTTANAPITRNGTYEADLGVGTGQNLSRAGDWDLKAVAKDFAGSLTPRPLGTFKVLDDAQPVLTVTVLPGAEQEAGDTITWQITVGDGTETRAPTLKVTRPGAPSQTFTLTYDEAKQAFMHEEPTGLSDLGTWAWEARVSDYNNNEAVQTGTVTVAANLPPRASNWSPAVAVGEGAARKQYGPPRPVISVDLLDRSGVEEASIELRVDGTKVTPTEKTAIVEGSLTGFRVKYNIDTPQPHSKVITATVKSKDRSTPVPLESPLHQHEFTIDAVRPTVTFTATPSKVGRGVVIIGAGTTITVTAADSDSGAGVPKVEIDRVAGPRVEARTTFDYTKPFKLNELTSVFNGQGQYQMLIDVTDRVGNLAGESGGSGHGADARLVFDDAPPLILLLAPNAGEPREKVRANITDEGGVATASIEYFTSGFAPRDVPMRLTGGVWNGTIPAFPKNTTVSFRIKASDIFGNSGASEISKFNASNQPPTVRILEPGEGSRITGKVPLRWQAQDVDTPASRLKITVLWARPGESFRAFTGAQSLQNTGSFVLDTTGLPNGAVTIRVLALDDASFGQDEVTVTVRNLAAIFVDAFIEPKTAKAGSEVLAGVKIITDVLDARAILVDKDGKEVVNATLLDDGQGKDASPNDGNFAATFKAPSAGAYSLKLYATTADGPAFKPDAATLLVEKGKRSPIPEFGVLTLLVAAGLALGLLGLRRRWD